MAPSARAPKRHGCRRLVTNVTIETTGTLLVGADIAAAATVIASLDVPVIGINCATGPQEMAEHVRWLGRELDRPALGPAQCRPARAGRRPHPLSALARGAGAVAGAFRRARTASTSSAAAAAADGRAHRGARRHAEAACVRAACGRRRSGAGRVWVPSLASLYSQVPLRQEHAYLSIGERCNANGTKHFRRLQERATGTAASGWRASRWPKARTRSISAPPSSAATRSPR